MRNIVLLVSSLLLTFNSFSQDNLDVDYFVKGKKDKNGYTHIKLNWDGEYWPRFTIGLYADTQDKEYWYNGSPVITSVASSCIESEAMAIDVHVVEVQEHGVWVPIF